MSNAKQMLGDVEEKLMGRAMRAYFKRFGEYADQPSGTLSGYEGGHLVLANHGGELARYRVELADSGLDGRLFYAQPMAARGRR
jgi:hypothetical protein